MARSKLNPKIIEIIVKKTDLAEASIRSNISNLRAKYPSCTINAVAQLYALEKGFSVMQKLSHEDKLTIPHNEVISPKIKIEKKPIKKKEIIIQLIKYESNDYFIVGHIQEVNKSYSKGCYTSCSILARKIIENLIIDILRRKFPPIKIENKELYFDIHRNRLLDFSIVLKNLYDKRHDFGISEAKIIARLYQKALKFKDDVNDNAHSWYYLVETRQEIDDLEIQVIIELIKLIEKSLL
jgi:hypothetical protein